MSKLSEEEKWRLLYI